MPANGESASRWAELSSFQLGRDGCGTSVALAEDAVVGGVWATTAPVLAVTIAPTNKKSKDLTCKRRRL